MLKYRLLKVWLREDPVLRALLRTQPRRFAAIEPRQEIQMDGSPSKSAPLVRTSPRKI